MASKVDRNKAYGELKDIINRLKKAEAELDKWSEFKHLFSKQFLSIKAKVKSPAQVDQVESELVTLKSNIKQYVEEERKKKESHDSASAVIERAKSEISKLQLGGYPVEEALAEIDNARKALDTNDYKSAVSLAQKAVQAGERGREQSKTKQRAEDVIRSVAAEINNAEANGLAVKKLKTTMEKAGAQFNEKEYEAAIKLAAEAGNDIAKAVKGAKPELTITMQESSYRPGEWKAVDITVENIGSASAKSVELEFSPEVEVKWLKDIARLDVGASEVLNVGLKPKDTGDIPLDVRIKYMDLKEKEYSNAHRFWLRVAETVTEKVSSEEPREKAPVPKITTQLSKNYELLDAIGFGGFSDVYKGIKKSDNVVVALKVPRMAQFQTVEPKQFMDEASIWSQLKHPNIITIYDYGSRPFPWIAMEYMEGGSLRNKIGNLSIKEALDILQKVCEAMFYAHHMGVIHRDMKPDNVLFTKDGVAKVGDWGLGRMMLALSTQSGTSGTPAYSAPEQIDPRQYGETGWWTDIYQLAAMAYEMLTGRTPFEGTSSLELAMNIVNKDLVKPSEINAEIPAKVDDIIMKALSKKKDARYKDVSVMMDDLSKID